MTTVTQSFLTIYNAMNEPSTCFQEQSENRSDMRIGSSSHARHRTFND